MLHEQGLYALMLPDGEIMSFPPGTTSMQTNAGCVRMHETRGRIVHAAAWAGRAQATRP